MSGSPSDLIRRAQFVPGPCSRESAGQRAFAGGLASHMLWIWGHAGLREDAQGQQHYPCFLVTR